MYNTKRKRIDIQPIKSPSPDYMNRCQIRESISPLKQIQSHRQLRSYSPQMSNSIIYHYPSRQIQQLRQQIATLKNQIQAKRQQQIKTINLTMQNNKYKEQTKYLQNFHTQIRKNHQKNGQSNDLKQLNKRLSRISEQNKNLLEKVQQQIQQMSLLQCQNQKIKKQLEFYQKQKMNNRYGNDKDFKSLQDKANQRYNQYKNYISQKVNVVQLKVSEIFQLQQALKQQIKKRNGKSKKQHQQVARQEADRQTIDSLKNLKQLRIYNTKLQQTVKGLRIQLEQTKTSAKIQEKEMQRKLNQLNCKSNIITEDYSQKKSYQRSFKEIQSQLTFLRQKINHLEAELQNKNYKIFNMQSQTQLKDRNCCLMQKRLEDIQNQTICLKRTLQSFQQSQQKLNQQLKDYKLQIISLKNINTQKEKRISQSQNESQLNKKVLEQQIKKRESIIQITLKNYLYQIAQIKQTLTSSDMEKIVSGTIQLQKYYTSFQKNKKQENIVVKELRKKLFLKEQQCIQIEKDNNLLRAQVQILKQQQIKLQQLIAQYYQSEKVQNYQQQSTKLFQVSSNLKVVVQRAISGIDQLEHELRNQNLLNNKIKL